MALAKLVLMPRPVERAEVRLSGGVRGYWEKEAPSLAAMPKMMGV